MAIKGYVYFVACAEPDCRKAHPFIKIGQTMKMKNRLAALQIGSPVELKFVGYIKTEDPKALERFFHKTFQRAWIYGEWFRVSDGMITSIRHYRIIDDKFDEFFSELPKFEIDPVVKAWMDLARSLEEEIGRLKGPDSQGMITTVYHTPCIMDNAAQKYDWGRIKH
jgi:hypothetical protein